MQFLLGSITGDCLAPAPPSTPHLCCDASNTHGPHVRRTPPRPSTSRACKKPSQKHSTKFPEKQGTHARCNHPSNRDRSDRGAARVTRARVESAPRRQTPQVQTTRRRAGISEDDGRKAHHDERRLRHGRGAGAAQEEVGHPKVLVRIGESTSAATTAWRRLRSAVAESKLALGSHSTSSHTTTPKANASWPPTFRSYHQLTRRRHSRPPASTSARRRGNPSTPARRRGNLRRA